jgi:hypothetical protein
VAVWRYFSDQHRFSLSELIKTLERGKPMLLNTKVFLSLCINLVLAFRVSAAAIEPIEVSSDGKQFVFSKSRQHFFPRGFNYDRDFRMRLLEDYWTSEWQTVEEDFQEMKSLRANVVRIHLQFGKFMDGPSKPNQDFLSRLKNLLTLAEKTGLYLDLTGLACYRKADVPSWFDALDEKGRWKAQAKFWSAIASTASRSPAVFCYDLINEPIVPTSKRPDWLVGEFGGFYYVQAISLDPGRRMRSAVSVAWVKQQTAAIRRHDRRHLITVGLLPDSADTPSSSGFIPKDLVAHLDFISVHLYPRSGHLENDLATLRKFSVGKPVIIEETYPLGATAAELKLFLDASRSLAAGWIGFYWGKTPNELSEAKTIGDASMREWLGIFQELSVECSRKSLR